MGRLPDVPDCLNLLHLFLKRMKTRYIWRLFFRWVIFVLQRDIQHDLKSLYPAIKTDGGDQYAGCLFVERHGPVSIIVPIESWHSLNLAALPDQPVRYRAAQKRRRGALKAQRVDLLIR